MLKSGYLVLFGMLILLTTLYLMRQTENDTLFHNQHSKTEIVQLEIKDDPNAAFDELVMVPCHGLWVEGKGWDVAPDRKYQIKTLERHITESVKYTQEMSTRMLMFSGYPLNIPP